MSQRVPLLKAKPARKPIRGLLIAPKVKSSSSQPTTTPGGAAPQTTVESAPPPAVTAPDTPKNWKSRAIAAATTISVPKVDVTSSRSGGIHASPSTPLDRVASSRRSGKPASPATPPTVAASPKRDEPKAAPIRIAVPSNSPAPRPIAPSRGIIAPGGSFGLAPPPKPIPSSTPQSSRPSPKGVPLPSRIFPSGGTSPVTTAASGPATRQSAASPGSTAPASHEERASHAQSAAKAPRDRDYADAPDDSDDAPMVIRTRKAPPKRLLGLPPRSKVAKGTARTRQAAKRPVEETNVPVKNQFLLYASNPPAERVVKRRPSARRQEPPPTESESQIASMTMGELAMSVPYGERGDDNQNTNEGSDEDDMPPAAATRKPTAPRGAATGRPQVEIVNGQIVLATNSLTVHEDELMQDDDDNESQASQSEHPRLGRSGYMSGRRPSKRWNYVETKQFFYCLSHVGTDFTLMETLFPNRTRAELKIKFKSEEKRHRALVDVALEGAKRPLDADVVALAAHNLKKLMAKKKSGGNDDDDEEDDDDGAMEQDDGPPAGQEAEGDFLLI